MVHSRLAADGRGVLGPWVFDLCSKSSPFVSVKLGLRCVSLLLSLFVCGNVDLQCLETLKARKCLFTMALAENSGLQPIETLSAVKAQQVKVNGFCLLPPP